MEPGARGPGRCVRVGNLSSLVTATQRPGPGLLILDKRQDTENHS